MTTESIIESVGLLEMLEWLSSSSVGHQPIPQIMPRTLPPTQPAPLLSGLIEAVLTTSTFTPATTLSTRAVGTNNNPLATKPPQAPSSSETLTVITVPAPASSHRTASSTIAVPAGAAGFASTPIMAAAATPGTALVGAVFSLLNAAIADTDEVPITLDLGGPPTILNAVVRTGAPIVLLLWNGPIAIGVNVNLTGLARVAGSTACTLYYSLWGIDL